MTLWGPEDMCWQRACRQVKHYDITRFPIHLWKSFSSFRREKNKGGPQSQGGIFGEFALSNVEGDVTSISYRTTSSSSQHPVPRCCRCRCMSSHGVLNPGSSPLGPPIGCLSFPGEGNIFLLRRVVWHIISAPIWKSLICMRGRRPQEV